MARRFTRVIWIVLDSVGIGAMPDAADFGDEGSDTLGNIAKQKNLKLPTLCDLGLANIRPLSGLQPGRESRWRVRKVRVGIAREGHDYGTLGNGGDFA